MPAVSAEGGRQGVVHGRSPASVSLSRHSASYGDRPQAAFMCLGRLVGRGHLWIHQLSRSEGIRLGAGACMGDKIVCG